MNFKLLISVALFGFISTTAHSNQNTVSTANLSIVSSIEFIKPRGLFETQEDYKQNALKAASIADEENAKKCSQLKGTLVGEIETTVIPERAHVANTHVKRSQICKR